MKVTSEIKWPNGNVTKRDVDFGDPQEARRFSHVARHALEEGGIVKTYKKGTREDSSPVTKKGVFVTGEGEA